MTKKNYHRKTVDATDTHCRNGHPKLPENIYMNPVTTVKSCMMCRRESLKRRRENEKKLDFMARQRLSEL
jgi:hypothetical protein